MTLFLALSCNISFSLLEQYTFEATHAVIQIYCKIDPQVLCFFFLTVHIITNAAGFYKFI